MPTYARVENGSVVEIINLPDGIVPSVAFHEDIARTIFACDSSVAVGFIHASGAFSAPPPVLPSKAELIAYATAKQVGVANGGVKVNLGTAKSPVNVFCRTNSDGRSLLSTAVLAASADSSSTTTWVSGGQAVTLNATQVLAIQAAVIALIQGSFATLGAISTAINAGSITTFDQIDNPVSPIPGWPSNS